MIEETKLTNAYDTWHEQHDVDAKADAPWHLLFRKCVNWDRDIAGKRVLEIGCGRGGFASWLINQNAPPSELIAADFSPAAVEMAKQYASNGRLGNVSWQVANIEKLDGFMREFDTVISFETIEHVPNPAQAVKALERVLKPGGILYLTTPNYFSSLGLYRAYCVLRGKKFDEGGQPICQWTSVPRVRIWLRRAGLQIVGFHGTGHYLPFPGRPPLRIKWLDKANVITRWTALHPLFIAKSRN